jgi:hypothetical protein|nr:MAG TPA: protein of unknown function (DUF4417) [Caudoviricetes sp.]
MGNIPFRQTRFWENCEKRIFDGVGKYDIPEIHGMYDVDEISDFIGWNYALKEKHPEDKAVHFFVDDYQFNRLWTNPDAYLEKLKRFQYVFTPDFSPYADFPKAVQVFNHFRKHWIGAYLQENGVRVIPTVTWSYQPSYDFCFDGEPKNSVVAISSVGCMKSKRNKQMLIDGYNEMVKRLEPSCIIFYGMVPDECKGNIIRVKPFQNKFKKAVCG